MSTFVSQNNVCKYCGIIKLSIWRTSNSVKADRPWPKTRNAALWGSSTNRYQIGANIGAGSTLSNITEGQQTKFRTSVATEFRIVDELFDGNSHKELPDCLPHHPLAGRAAEYGELEDSPCARTIGNAIHLVPELRGRAGDKLRGQVSSVVALVASPSNRDLHFFKELFPLWLRKANDHPSEAGQ